MTKFSSPFMAKSPLKDHGEPHADTADEAATYQLMNEGIITETDEASQEFIAERVKQNLLKKEKKELASSHRGLSGA